MQYNMLKGKIHRAVVKQADLNYVGSITVDTDLLEAAGILEYELVQIVDVENGNPNGDPDAGNMPRVDPETGNGIITDVCLKRKIRNYVQDVKEDESGWRIYIKDQVPLNRSDLEAGEALGIGEELAEMFAN